MEIILLMVILDLLGMQFPYVRASVMPILLHSRIYLMPANYDMGIVLHTLACTTADRQRCTAWRGPST